jgi:endonuclease YncB( thermonuclease family)
MFFILAAAAGLCIASVHDGDTIRLCGGERVRLAGIDAPEVVDSPRCSPQQRQRLAGSKNPPWCDYRAGDASRDGLRAFLLTGRVSIERLGRDDYGRTLANLYVNDRDAGEYLIRRGLARGWRR